MNRNTKPAIVVSIPLVWGVRNVLRSGLYAKLSNHFRVVLAAPEEGQQDLLREGIDQDDLWILDHPKETVPHSRLMKALKSAHARKHPTPSDHIFGEWAKQKFNGKNGSPRLEISEAAYKGIGLLASHPHLFHWLEQNEDDAYQRMIPQRTWDLLRETRPIFGLSTSHVVNWEWALFRAMHTLRIPIATQILSFDNLTTRGYLPTKHFDHFVVWQKRMAEELEQFYGIAPERITVTGTPQFDFHVREDHRWSRERTTHSTGLDRGRPYFVYCANTRALTPREPELVVAILRAVSANRRLENHQWLLRLHPLDDYQRWESLPRQFAQVRLNQPWTQGGNATFWGTPSNDELGLLGNILRYADATLTMGSSIALDSAVVDTPIICVGFHPRSGSAEDRFYRESHFSHHYRPIMESKAVPLATNMSELMGHLGCALTDRGALREERACLVAKVCGRVDGNAAKRIAETVIKFVNARAIPGRQPTPSMVSQNGRD